MKDFEIMISKQDGRIDILYSGYNIISETLYNERLVEKIIDLLQNELDLQGDNLEDIIEYK